MEELLTIAEVAAIFRVEPVTARHWIKTGILEAVHLPRVPGRRRQEYRIKRSTLAQLLNTTAK